VTENEQRALATIATLKGELRAARRGTAMILLAIGREVRISRAIAQLMDDDSVVMRTSYDFESGDWVVSAKNKSPKGSR
jgi:hypothetical protein